MPPTPASVIEQWLNLPRPVLQDKVRQVVKRRDADAKQIWAHVRANSVLAAQVRGALSALRADVKGTRDEVMWTMWIDQARAVLDASSSEKAPEKPAADKIAVEKPAVQKSENGSARKFSGEKKQPAEAPVAERDPDAEAIGELAFAPQPTEKPRPAPTVPPVMFQAPGT
jgi:hypothetical protein